jgi:hypothetical protein
MPAAVTSVTVGTVTVGWVGVVVWLPPPPQPEIAVNRRTNKLIRKNAHDRPMLISPYLRLNYLKQIIVKLIQRHES